MYPRNATTPPRIAIGAVVQISDGAVQTSGVSVAVRPEGGSETSSGGTVSYGSSSIVYYAPTQAETDYTAFVVVAYKTGCIPVSQTIITTDSSTAGTVKLAPTTHTGAVVPTVTTLTGHTPQTGDAYARLGAPAGASVSADVAAVKTDTGNLVTRITATLFSGITSLAQWLGMLAGKQTPNGTAQTELRATGAGSGTYDATTDSHEAIRDRGDAAWGTGSAPSAASIADAVWDESLSGHATSGSAGAALSAAGAAGDPWSTVLPGPYGAGTAGKIVGDNLNATVGSRATPGDVPTADEIADGFLDRDMAAGADTGSATKRTPRQALRILRNRWTITGTTQSIKKENDSTESWSQELGSTAGADPVTSTDPAGP